MVINTEFIIIVKINPIIADINMDNNRFNPKESKIDSMPKISIAIPTISREKYKAYLSCSKTAFIILFNIVVSVLLCLLYNSRVQKQP